MSRLQHAERTADSLSHIKLQTQWAGAKPHFLFDKPSEGCGWSLSTCADDARVCTGAEAALAYVEEGRSSVGSVRPIKLNVNSRS
jgi:hypothetical protein